MKLAMKSTLTKGTPRTSSMSAAHIELTIGHDERRPKANAMDKGNASTMLTMASIKVKAKPPHKSVVTGGKPHAAPLQGPKRPDIKTHTHTPTPAHQPNKERLQAEGRAV
jgi:hypothetical protein